MIHIASVGFAVEMGLRMGGPRQRVYNTRSQAAFTACTGNL
jgi:hypothetical protein